ncbi:hypothetical protein [Calycomorphotria hydatis]|uniref:Uncharacterized protein n=1 Tax=Calycomorphotria hydatis TaxID=2528027 RepID=A0A517TAK1_9PLAN|nr:hypothetical protein [Calycomorphotria hydatis]QDT65401.1 hypothetical protein V22_26540 [Calycomorphotria hydatis]
MARRHEEERAFGSDSFLDIVANIVGILIILIVIAGVRMAQMPAMPEESVADNAAPESVSITPTPTPTPITVQSPVVVQTPVRPVPKRPKKTYLPPVVAPRPIIVELDPEQPPAIPVDNQLVARKQELQSQLLAYRQKATEIEKQRHTLQLQQATLSKEIQDTQQQLGSMNQSLRDKLAATRDLQKELQRLAELKKLGQERLEQLDETPTVQLRHELTPEGHEVKGPEMHFRISEGKISRVPLKELIEEMGPQIRKQVSWLVRNGTGTGNVGPIEGYSLAYVVRKGKNLILDDLYSNRGSVRIEVAGWKVIPEKTLREEAADLALRSDSQFRTWLRLAPRRTALTFWVYPDSFDAFRKLQSYAHREGFTVAGRPLPFGVPIAGSPDGSRSMGR